MAVVLIVSAVLDFCYTYLYSNKIYVSKFQYIKKQANKEFDYIFLGSSRVVNTVNTTVVDSVLGSNSINFGVLDAQPQDLVAMLKIIDEYNIKYKTIFIQLDYYYNSKYKSKFLYTDLLPFIHENKSINSYYANEEDYWLLNYLPFYRYCKSDAKLGIRELIASFFRKNKNEKDKGFLPLEGFGHKWQRELPDHIDKNNEYSAELMQLLNSCESNKYVIFVAPFRPDTKRMEFIQLLESEVIDLWDFSTSITEENKFMNGYHLNDIGAKEFSIQLSDSIKYHLTKQ